jgi:hypothetical protein
MTALFTEAELLSGRGLSKVIGMAKGLDRWGLLIFEHFLYFEYPDKLNVSSWSLTLFDIRDLLLCFFLLSSSL